MLLSYDFCSQIASVDRFVHHVNATLHHQHEEERLQAIVDKIEPYDAIDAPNDECLKVMIFLFSFDEDVGSLVSSFSTKPNGNMLVYSWLSD